MTAEATPQAKTRLALAALLLMTCIWGYNWVIMKEVLRYAHPLDFTALRTLFGALVLFLVLLARRQSLKPTMIGPTLLLGLLQTAAFTLLVQTALLTGGAGKVAVLVYTMPFWVLPIAWAVLGERIRGLQWPAIAIAAGGLLMLLEPWANGATAIGNVLGVTGGLIWAISTVVAKRIRARHKLDLLSLTAWQMLLGASVLCIAALAVPTRPIEPSAYFFGALAFNAVLATGLAWLLWLFALNHLSAGTAGLSSLGAPMISVLAAWLQLGERPSAAEAAGMVAIAAALLLMSAGSLWQRRRNRAKAKAPPADAG